MKSSLSVNAVFYGVLEFVRQSRRILDGLVDLLLVTTHERFNDKFKHVGSPVHEHEVDDRSELELVVGS